MPAPPDRVRPRPMLTIADFDYPLPPELIAQHPASVRSASRLLTLAADGTLADRMFAELPLLIAAGDLLVFNDTRVIPARLHGAKESGGKVEVLVERITSQTEALAHVRASKSPRAGARLRLADAFEVEVLGRDDDLFRLRFPDDVLRILEAHGAVPLPPYIGHLADAADAARYQTVYARAPGAVAAPTAGLHFDDAMLARLREMGVDLAWLTLHVGAGTFQPVRVERIDGHRMHSERYEIGEATVRAIAACRERGGRVVAVGTTSLRALEGCVARHGRLVAGHDETSLFITPGFHFQVADRLITNFHLPKSTLLMLISAFAGMAPVRAAYAHAIRERYRFFSYGDAMLIDRASGLPAGPDPAPGRGGRTADPA